MLDQPPAAQIQDTEIAIIGGGVHGTGIAQAAAAAGYKVAIFERHHWAAGTSQRSSKLIHGGLRYLETGQIPLVYHSLHERAILLRNAPELVHPVKFFIPIYNNTQRRPWQIRAGLMLYFLLSGGGKLGRFRKLKRQEWGELDGLETEGLQAVFQYWDGQTDDRLLTEAVIRSAEELGAASYYPVELIRAERNQHGYLLTLQGTEGEFQCQCRCLVNATGPWINEVGKRIDSPVSPRDIDLVQGTHILVDKHLTQGVFYMEAPSDGRAVFAMPWGDKALIGTTELVHQGPADQVMPTAGEIAYLQETFAHYFPNSDTTVLDAWAGLRVLPKSSSIANKRDRDTFLQCDNDRQPNLVSVYGGKLTSYRHTSQRVVDLLKPYLGPRKSLGDTRSLPLSAAKNSHTEA